MLFLICVNCLSQIDSGYLPVRLEDSVNKVITISSDSIVRIRPQISLDAIQDVFLLEETRRNEIEKNKVISIPRKKRELPDTNYYKELNLPYRFYINKNDTLFLQDKYFLRNIGKNEFLSYINPYMKVIISENTNNIAFMRYNDYILNPAKYERLKSINKLNSIGKWSIGILTFGFIIFAWCKLLYNRYFNQILRAAFIYHNSYSLFRDNNIVLRRISFALNTLFAVNISLFLTHICIYYNFKPFELSYFIYFLFFLGILILYYFIHSLLILLTGLLFYSINKNKEYVYNNYLLNKNVGIYIFPIIAVLPYINDLFAPYLIVFGVIILIFFYLLRLFRGFQIILQKGISIFYLILYLCTLEFLPMVWMYRFIISFI